MSQKINFLGDRTFYSEVFGVEILDDKKTGFVVEDLLEENVSYVVEKFSYSETWYVRPYGPDVTKEWLLKFRAHGCALENYF